MHAKRPQGRSSTAPAIPRGITLLIRTEVTKESVVLSIGRNKSLGALTHRSKTFAAIARLDQPKLLSGSLSTSAAVVSLLLMTLKKGNGP
jgi:hypothetical protein